MEIKNFHGLKLLSLCGGGAYGEVYYCEDITGKKMAVKIVSKKKLNNSWKRELQGVINYRKITENASDLLKIFHVAEDDTCFYYTMEAADSISKTKYEPDTLASRLQSGPIPEDELFTIFFKVLVAIKTIHSNGFAHRDIKPDNIIFVNGEPKLGDIGLLSSLSNTMTQLVGTLEFIPPEERSAEYLDSSDRIARQRNDLYAFGKVIYCAITGMNPIQYPTVPKNLTLSLPVKYFLRLSFLLCNKNPQIRLNDLSKLTSHFLTIERQLKYGENYIDKIKYIFDQIKEQVWVFFITLFYLFKTFWYILILCVFISGISTYFIFNDKQEKKVPEKEDVSNQVASNLSKDKKQETTKLKNYPEVKEYYNKQYKMSLTIPFNWDVFTKENYASLLKNNLGDAKVEDYNFKYSKKALSAIKDSVNIGQEMIVCNIEDNFLDNIIISNLPLPKKEVLKCSLAELQLFVKQAIKYTLGVNATIFECKKTKVANFDAISFELTTFENTLSNIYWILKDSEIIVITLASETPRYEMNKKSFEKVLTTIKFKQ